MNFNKNKVTTNLLLVASILCAIIVMHIMYCYIGERSNTITRDPPCIGTIENDVHCTGDNDFNIYEQLMYGDDYGIYY